MPGEKARSAIKRRWQAAQRMRASMARRREMLVDRAAEEEAIARHVAERGVTALPPAEPLDDRSTNALPQPMPGWNL